MVTIFFPSMEGGLARRIIPVEQQHCQAVEVGQTKLSFTGSLTLTFCIHVFFFGPRELFTYPPDVPYPIIM